MSGVQIIELDDTNTCKLCTNALGKYSCPRCNVLYCSVTCYRSVGHSACSETFYKDAVLQEMSALDPESRRQMEEMLGRTSEAADELQLDSDDDSECADLGERLQGVNLDDPDKVWERLNDDERQEFAAFLKSDEVAKVIPKWLPWWERGVERVKVVGEKSGEEAWPEIRETPTFDSICRKGPSDSVQYNLMNVLVGYVFTTRYFNGDHFEFCEEAAKTLLTVSDVLRSAGNFEDFETAVKSVEQQCFNTDWITVDAENVALMRNDLQRILRGPPDGERQKHFVLAALSDIVHLLTRALAAQKRRKNAGDEPKIKGAFGMCFPEPALPRDTTRGQLRAAVRKVEYLLAFARDKLVLG